MTQHSTSAASKRILVTGASGFVGRAVIQELLGRGHTVLAGSRMGNQVGGAQGIPLDVTVPAETHRAVDQARPDAVVHLVGIIAPKGNQTFERVHVEGVRNVLAALPSGTRYLHMSALGARPDSRSEYSSSKGRAERLVQASGLPYTIFRPSLIFGQWDDFFGHVLKDLVSSAPVVPVIGDGQFPFRPVSVQDVAVAFANALERPQSTTGQRFDLTGPTEYTFRELLELELRALNLRKPLVPVPLALMNLAVPLMQVLPQPPITPDQYAMLTEGNSAPNEPARSALSLPMLRLEHHLPEIVRPHKDSSPSGQ